MNALSRTRLLRLRRQHRGFSLIELGIVIAVIAVLASVVIFGRGFITAGRVSKTVEAMNTVRKAAAAFAGLQGGTFTGSTGPEIATLGRRGLLPVQTDFWIVNGQHQTTDPNAFVIQDVRMQQISVVPLGGTVATGRNVVAIKVKTPTVEQAEDLWTSANVDSNYHRHPSAVGQMGIPCTGTTKPSSNVTIFCFNL